MSQSSLLGVPAAEAAGITAADIDTSAEEAGISYRDDPLLDEEDDSPLADYADEAERQQDA